MPFNFHRSCLCSLLLLHIPLAVTVLTNRTIDDTFGDPITGMKPSYLPTTLGVWKNAGCSDCAVVPDPAKAFNGTWTSATYNPGLGSMSVSFGFTGIAIYIYFILANNVAPGITTLTECNFTINNELVGSFQHIPSSESDPNYDSLVYSNTSLLNTAHNFSIVTSGVDHNVLVIFDYAIYTTNSDDNSPAPSASSISSRPSSVHSAEDSSPTGQTRGDGQSGDPSTASKPFPTGVVAGGVAGGVVFLALTTLGICLFLRRRRRSSKDKSIDKLIAEPFTYTAANHNLARGQTTSNHHTPPSVYTRPITSHSTSEPITQVFASSDGLGYTPSSTSANQPISESQVLQIKKHQRDRLAELERQMQTTNREIQSLDPHEMGAVSLPLSSSQTVPNNQDAGEIDELREQVRLMRMQIERIQQEQQTLLAQGFSDEPPPVYHAGNL